MAHPAPGLTVAVASLAAQSVLKIMARRDRRHTTTRDALDLRTILDAYSTGTYLDELYDEYPTLLERYEFDPELAGAARLGQEAARTLAREGCAVVVEILENDTSFTALAAGMGGRQAIDRGVLEAYRSGFSDDYVSSEAIITKGHNG